MEAFVRIDIIRATPDQLLALWNGRFDGFIDDTLRQMAAGELENYQIREDGVPFGEISVVWRHADPEEANGRDTATLQGFRIDEAHEGRGFGGRLIRYALDVVRSRGFRYCTIGADDFDGERLRSMYRHLGFTETVKRSEFEYDYRGEIKKCTYTLLRQELS